MSHKKTERNAEICKLHEKNPKLTLEEIGRMYGVTKQRVSIILKGG